MTSGIELQIKVALPKGFLLNDTAGVLERAGWGLSDYSSKARLYRLTSSKFPNMLAKMFHEKDIPIQVAIGNYDLGICGADWADELLCKYPSSGLIKVKNLGYGPGALYMLGSASLGTTSMAEISSKLERIRIASEYPNLAEAFALKQRLPRFSIFPVWGAAEAYPPETADLALVAVKGDAAIPSDGLVTIAKVFESGAFLIANKKSWESKDLSEMVASIYANLPMPKASVPASQPTSPQTYAPARMDDKLVKLALPDGHQQSATLALLKKAGIQVDEAEFKRGGHRPSIGLDGVVVKIIRPQDMPQQVANGNFDLAITGKDWLLSQLYQFPSSPVQELLDLKSAKVRIVAVVSNKMPVNNTHELRAACAKRETPLRVAAEYVNIADKYARDNHLGAYRVVPTWGATEAFLPEDADVLIENTETGTTIARHDLKIIDTLFESAGCLVGNTDSLAGAKGKQMREIAEMLRKAVESPV
jgi:ATP phosphoribosyltransferase